MYQVIREKRKTMTLLIDDTLCIIIKVPYDVKDREIERFVSKNRTWIEGAIERKRKRIESSNWIAKGEINYLGNPVKITIVETRMEKKRVDYTENGFKISVQNARDHEQIKWLMENYLKQEAYNYFVALTDWYCKALGCQYNKVSIRKQKTRWGSCSAKGNLSYNVKLIGAPREVIAYVILHEVVHLIHFNHSKAFWDTVGKMMPSYKEQEAYLKKNGMYLEI